MIFDVFVDVGFATATKLVTKDPWSQALFSFLTVLVA